MFTMRKLCLVLSILISNINYGITSSENPDEQPGVDEPKIKSVKVELELPSEEGHEVTEPSASQEQHPDPEKEPAEQLFAKDYYRVDSASSYEHISQWLNEDLKNQLDPSEQKQYKFEVAAGDMTQLFGTNTHHHQVGRYPDLGRRFVPQYPYREIINQEDVEDNSLTPKKAPPELVLAVAKESAILAAATPKNPADEVMQKSILRTGEYWNSFWKEDVDPKKMLRTKEQGSKLKSVIAKLSPGTEIYDLVSKLNQLHPKVLYVINKNNKH